MMSLAVEPKDLGIALPNVELSRTSLVISGSASEEDLSRLEAWLNACGGSALWWWGDYLVHLTTSRGKEYARAKAMTSYAPESLRQAAWVSRHVAQDRRMRSLSWSHHLEVAALTPTEQELWLCRADEEDWSVKELRAEIRRSKAEATTDKDQSPIDARAARAWEGFETFSAWYQGASPAMSAEQRQESAQALRPLVADVLMQLTDEELDAMLEARTLALCD